MEEVRGSIPLISTKFTLDTFIAERDWIDDNLIGTSGI
jgi:hypothetical protein